MRFFYVALFCFFHEEIGVECFSVRHRESFVDPHVFSSILVHHH